MARITRTSAVASVNDRLAYRPEELSDLIGVGTTTIRGWIRAGDLPAVRIGRCVLIPSDAVSHLLAS